MEKYTILYNLDIMQMKVRKIQNKSALRILHKTQMFHL